MGSNRGNNPKHGPGYTCYKNATGKRADKAKTARRIALGKKLAQQRAQQKL